jgi:hypothetical protein
VKRLVTARAADVKAMLNVVGRPVKDRAWEDVRIRAADDEKNAEKLRKVVRDKVEAGEKKMTDKNIDDYAT